MGNKVTTSQIGRMKEMVKVGMRPAHIAKKMGLSERTVRRWVWDEIVESRESEREALSRRNNAIYNRYENGVSVKEIALAESLSPEYVREILRRYRTDPVTMDKGWTWETSPTRKLTLEDALDVISRQGELPREVAARHGVTPNAIRKIWKRRCWKAAWDVYDGKNASSGPG